MKIRITRLDLPEMEDENYTNITIGSEHETVQPPSVLGVGGEGVWIMGSNFPTKLFPDEYEVVN